MKFKIILLFLLSTISVFSQTKKGDIFVQGTLQGTGSFYQSYYSNNNTFFTPGIKFAGGIFISNHNAIGLQIQGSYYDRLNSYKNGYMAGVSCIHLYMYSIGDNWGFSWNNESSYSRGRITYKSSNNGLNALEQQFTINASPGLYCLLFNRVTIHASFSLLSINYTKISTDKDYLKFETAHEFEDLTISGVLPGALTLSEVQVRLAYFIRKTN